ncbi:Cyanophycinase precursor [Pirellula sp. SH-Sr6A]|uniref:cyanophycinase n=1 Tax=Pirellula sp. SH-Sr6A TaxID=1632865 RepID=UPI00078CAB83|nr:cyanophycinase [Pirellula sp. SH-Sr6A]AMV30708.1 Cyanophycinase precursor [Pirellula sp. SH-Sr6A]
MVRLCLALILSLASGLLLSEPVFSQADVRPSNGQLIMVGGGLGVSNRSVFLDLIEAAGGTSNAKFVLLPAASLSLDAAHHFQKELSEFGIQSNQVEILNVLHSNADQATRDPVNVEKVDRATAVYMTGGDQVRLVRALTNSDGTDTPLLVAMRRLYARGGVIAGTSAGASAQSTKMLSASGLPSMFVDEGLDALDFGLTKDTISRGILVTRGLGFLQNGVIDQHFLQYRGRLARLSRVILERKIPFGIGIDRDSAIRVRSDGKVMVTGGRAIVVLADRATVQSGPTGCSLSNLNVSLISEGDCFDPLDLTFTLHSSRKPIAEEDVTFDGGFRITDIGSGYAVANALIGGLAENTQSNQEGIVLQYHDDTSHGYRYEFIKTPASKSFLSDSLDGSRYSVLHIQINISPIANGLFPAHTQHPVDLSDLGEEEKLAATAVAFRGMLTTNQGREFRPFESVTRREFAVACVRCLHLNAPKDEGLHDTNDKNRLSIELRQAMEVGFIKRVSDGELRLDEQISIQDLKLGLDKLAALYSTADSSKFRVDIAGIEESAGSTISRGRLARLLVELLFPQGFGGNSKVSSPSRLPN